MERGLVDMSATPVITRWRPPPDEVFEEEPVKVVLPTAEDAVGEFYYLLIMCTTTRDRLASFAVMLYVEEAGDEHEMARVDCCHDEVHVHYFQRGGDQIDRRVLLDITEPNDVEAGYLAAMDVMDEAEEIWRRWNGGR